MKMFKKLYEEKKMEFFSQIGKDVLLREKDGKQISLKEFLKSRQNSYERKFLLKKVDNETLVYLAKHYIKNAGIEFRKSGKYDVAEHYNHALKSEIIHMLIDRLENSYGAVKWEFKLSMEK
jgi:hypothetical protein